MAYFDRLGDDRFLATAQVGGAWDVERQHIAPALGLLVHAVEQHRDGRRSDHLRVARLSFDILGTIPLAEVHVRRPGAARGPHHRAGGGDPRPRAAREPPDRVVFPTVDLTVHFFTEPRGEWVGLDTSVSFGATGLGLTSSIVHDLHGPVGTMAQSLTVRRAVSGPGAP